MFPAILMAALVLGLYSYSWSRKIADTSERALARSTEVVGKKLVDAVEKRIIGGDHILFDLADNDNLRQLPLKNVPQVEAVAVLDEKLAVLPGGYVSRAKRGEAANFRKLFETKILPELHLERLRDGEYKHLHQEFDGRYYLLSYMKRRSPSRGDVGAGDNGAGDGGEVVAVDGEGRPHEEPTASVQPAARRGEPLSSVAGERGRASFSSADEGRVRYVVLNLGLRALKKELFGEELTKQSELVVAVRDDQDRLVFGEPVGRGGGQFLFESVFPTTLYLWRLQVAPRDVDALATQSRRGAVANVLLIAVPLAVIIFGTVFFLLAVRKEQIANELKSDFISNVSHELKTPLSLIRMFGELLATGKVKGPKAAEEYVQIVWRESERLSRLIDNVLDFARIERGKAAYDFVEGNLAEVVARGLDVYHVQRDRERPRSLVTDIEPQLPPVRLDETAMTLAFMNLVDNAVKYSTVGEIRIQVARGHGGVELSVSDQGPGIAVEEQTRIFERFYRSKVSRQQPIRGTGIGLSLVRNIAEAHGGRVTVDSAPGQGATFVLWLPTASRPTGDVPRPPQGASEGRRLVVKGPPTT